MIYSSSRNVLIYTPFKNYSSSIDAYFSPIHQFSRIVGCNPDYTWCVTDRWTGMHTPDAPAFLKSDKCTKFLPIRNPFDRVLSQWHWHIKFNGEIEFDEWLTLHANQPALLPVTLVYRPHDVLIRCENIEEELRKHGLMDGGRPFPKENVTEHKRTVQFTERQKCIIRFLHHTDFVAGGYSREPENNDGGN